MDKNVNVIDLGSSSVRYACFNSCGELLFKTSQVTRLAEGKKDGYLSEESIKRTTIAVLSFVNQAKKVGGQTYIFATASVRNSLNGKEFAQILQDLTGIKVDILSGDEEAEIGLLGALRGKNGGVIDVGGASSEIIVASNNKIVYEKSLPYGGVVLKNESENDLFKANKIIKEQLGFYGQVPSSNFYGIGGTATCTTAVVLGLKEYDAKKVHGHKLTFDELLYAEKFLNENTSEQVALKTCVPQKRAEILPFGLQILKEIFLLLNITEITVSESDNLEGYILKKGGLGYEKG